MTEIPSMARFSPAAGVEGVTRIAVVSASDQLPFPGLVAALPHLRFDSIGPCWPDRAPSGYDVLIVPVDGASAVDVEAAARHLRATPAELRVVVMLHHADIATTRLLLREGAADVLTTPVT